MLLVTLVRCPSLEQPFDNDSGANAYHARLIGAGEPLYGTHHSAHHLPGIQYTYALAFLLFGDSVWAVKFLLIPWTIVTAYLVYRLGLLVMDRVTGLLAAIFYVILTTHLGLTGTTAQTELFANLPRLAAILVLIFLVVGRAEPWKFILVGLLSAIAFLYKAVYLSPLGVAGFVLLVELWQDRTIPGAWRLTIRRGLWVGLGFLGGLFIVITYFGLLGLLPRFLLVFSLGQQYVDFRNTNPIYSQLWPLFPFWTLAANNAVLLIFSLAGLSMMLIHKTVRSSMAFYVVIWYLFSFVEATATRILFAHYYLLMVPPLALLAAWFLLRLYRDTMERAQINGRFYANTLLIGLLAITLSLSIAGNYQYYKHYVRYRLGQASYDEFLILGWPGIGLQLVQVQELADYLQERTAPTDRIYYWSGNVQLYYLANRRAPIETILPLYVDAFGPYQRVFVPQTKYVIVGESNNIPRPDWLYPELAKNYRLETVIANQQVYRRVADGE
jgi:hypothetical protein